MGKIPELEYAIICDDIRHEVGNKFSLIGVYGSDIYPASMPFLFPKLSFAIAYKHLKGGDTFLVQLVDPSGNVLKDTISGQVPKELASLRRFMIFGSFPPMLLEKSGSYKLVIVINEDEENAQEVSFAIKAAAEVIHYEALAKRSVPVFRPVRAPCGPASYGFAAPIVLDDRTGFFRFCKSDVWI